MTVDRTVGSWQKTALTVGVILALTACSSGADGTNNLEPRVQAMVPTGAPGDRLAPREGQPAGTRLVSSKYFTMSVPTSFTQKSALMDNGASKFGFSAPTSTAATPVMIGVVPDPKATKSAVESSYGLEAFKQAEGAKNLTRSMVKWPGTQSAVLVQWTETLAGAGPSRNWQLITQVNDNLVISVVAIAPAEKFDAAGLSKIMETFRPHP